MIVMMMIIIIRLLHAHHLHHDRHPQSSCVVVLRCTSALIRLSPHCSPGFTPLNTITEMINTGYNPPRAWLHSELHSTQCISVIIIMITIVMLRLLIWVQQHCRPEEKWWQWLSTTFSQVRPSHPNRKGCWGKSKSGRKLQNFGWYLVLQ